MGVGAGATIGFWVVFGFGVSAGVVIGVGEDVVGVCTSGGVAGIGEDTRGVDGAGAAAGFLVAIGVWQPKPFSSNITTIASANNDFLEFIRVY